LNYTRMKPIVEPPLGWLSVKKAQGRK